VCARSASKIFQRRDLKLCHGRGFVGIVRSTSKAREDDLSGKTF
jgi:hypothetical protein